MALLRILEGKIPHYDTAALPGFASQSNFDAVFLGINGLADASPSELKKYPAGVRNSLQASISALMPRRMSMTSDRAGFANSSTDDNEILVPSGTDAQFITYKMSTTPGSSGSAITVSNSRELLGKCRFRQPDSNGTDRTWTGIHVRSNPDWVSEDGTPQMIVTPRTVNVAINLNTEEFRYFASNTIISRLHNSRAVESWKYFVDSRATSSSNITHQPLSSTTEHNDQQNENLAHRIKRWIQLKLRLHRITEIGPQD